LGLTQEEVQLNGHAIEVRLYAEDPAKGFLPSTGTVACFEQVAREGVRYDTGIVGGQEISPFYDPMIAKLITTGANRETARKLMIEALTDTALFGPRTNRDFLIACLENEKFAEGDFSTGFIAEQFSESDLADKLADETALAILAVRHFVIDREAALAKASASGMHVPQGLMHFTSDASLRTPYKLAFKNQETEAVSLSVRSKRADSYQVHIGETCVEVLVRAHDGTRMVLETNGRQYISQAFLQGTSLFATLDGATYTCSNMLMRNAAGEEVGDGSRVVAPMHGRVVEVFVDAGDTVASGDRLVIVEAMKMQHEILATVDGVVEQVLVSAEAQVAADDLMIAIEMEAE
jgi:geranyl-CoA carboxylase alpha subunit